MLERRQGFAGFACNDPAVGGCLGSVYVQAHDISIYVTLGCLHELREGDVA